MDTQRGLTPEDIAILSQPFPFEAHEFYRGFTYIKRDYVADRIDMVDLNWQFEVLETYQRDRVAVARSVLTINGIRRGDVGMGQIEYITDKKGDPREITEAEKSAVTDSLKRCGWHFHIARYLRFLPNVKTDSDGRPLPRDLQRFRNALSELTGEVITLTHEEAVQLAAWYTDERGLTHTDAKAALGIENLTKYTGDLEQAKARIEAWLKSQLAGARK